MSDFDDVETLAARGQKIQAIKEFRSRTGVGLKDAKDAVEWFQEHGHWPAQYGGGTTSKPGPTAAPQPVSDDRLAALEQLLERGKLIHAIKELRSLTRWSLKDSKNAVDQFRAGDGWPARLVVILGIAGASKEAPQPPAASDAGGPSVQQAIADHLGYAPELSLVARARRVGLDGQLVMLRDRACFVRDDGGRWVVDRSLSYDLVTHIEVDDGPPTTLYVSVADVHERFEMEPADASAALALFRVFAR